MNFHPELKRLLTFQNETPVCPYCQDQFKFMKLDPGRTKSFYYYCKRKFQGHPDILHLTHSAQNEDVSQVNFCFKMDPSETWTYEIDCYFEADQMHVNKDHDGYGQTPDILVCPIPGANIFDLPNLVRKIKLYRIFS